MRDELTLMELADRYLRGELNATDRVAFEERMRTNAELRELVDDQRALLGGIKRLALRPAVNKAYRSYKFGKWAPGIGGAAVIAILALSGWMLAKESGHSMEASHDTSAQVEQLLTLRDTTGTGLPALVMMIDPKTDTTMITPNGLVVDIPKGAFIDGAGKAITKPVRVTMLEAIDGVDIMKAGLSTMSGDTLLETGGMFYIDAQVDGKRVSIDPTKPLTVMVPSEQADRGMMLYEGVMTEEGVVDWRNPKPLTRTLVPLDISTLDFYPPGYLEKVAELGKDATNKRYTDSLYFSFGGALERLMVMGPETNNILTIDRVMLDTMYSTYRSDAPSIYRNVGIDPAKVQAIWNERFNGTNIATREFEERFRAIHRMCNNEALELYVNNLDKNLSELDVMVENMGDPMFSQFSKRDDGRVQLPEHAAQRLRKVYAEWSQRYADVARKTQEEFYRKEAEVDQQAYKQQLGRQMKDAQQEQNRFRREFDANLKDALRQLGIEKNGPTREPPTTAYVANVTNPGWWNVDRAVFQSTADRNSMSFTDAETGKTATLTYTPITIEVADKDSFSELRVYLIPKELNSYQRVMETNGVFTEKLNALFQYDLVCMGRKNGQLYAASQESIAASGSITINMQPTDEESLRRMVHTPQTTASLVSDLVEQSHYLEWLELEAKRQQAKAKREEFRSALMAVVFPCWGEGVPAE